jgi:hypothetical protein
LFEHAGALEQGFGLCRCGGTRLVAHRSLAALEHAFAHIVLKRQRAHRELGHIVFDRLHRVHEIGASVAARRCGGSRLGLRITLDLAHAFGGHRKHLDAVGARLGGKHHRVFAQGLADKDQGITRSTRSESADVHAFAPMIDPMRIEWVSGISE